MFRYLTTCIQTMHRNSKDDSRTADTLIHIEFETVSDLHDSCGDFALTIEETEDLISKLAQSVHVAKEARDIYGDEDVITVNVFPREAPIGDAPNNDSDEEESPEHASDE